MWKCEALEVFPSRLNNLIALEELDCLKCRALEHVPNGFGMLRFLKKLDMWECEAFDNGFIWIEQPHSIGGTQFFIMSIFEIGATRIWNFDMLE